MMASSRSILPSVGLAAMVMLPLAGAFGAPAGPVEAAARASLVDHLLARLADADVDGVPFALAEPEAFAQARLMIIRDATELPVVDRPIEMWECQPWGSTVLLVGDGGVGCPLQSWCGGAYTHVIIVGNGNGACFLGDELRVCSGLARLVLVIGNGNGACLGDHLVCMGGGTSTLIVVGASNSVCSGGRWENCDDGLNSALVVVGAGNAVCDGTGESCSGSFLAPIFVVGNGNSVCGDQEFLTKLSVEAPWVTG